MTILKRKTLLVLLLLLSVFNSNKIQAQNLDLINGKEFDEMAKLNPAFTGVLEELRLLVGQSAQLRAGIESKLFKSVNYVGFNFEMDEIDHLKRQSYQFNYAREKEFGENLKLKFAGTADYQVRTFHRSATDTAFSFSDFNGNVWSFIEGTTDFNTNTNYVDIGLGIGGIYKNLIFGINLNQLGNMSMDLNKDGEGVYVPIEFNAQVGGFMNLGSTIKLFPNLIYSAVGDESMFALGLGATKGNWSLNGQFESFDYSNSGRISRLDIGVFGRINRFLIGFSYLHWNTPPTQSSELTKEDFRLTLNTSLFNRKNKKAEGIFSDLRKFY